MTRAKKRKRPEKRATELPVLHPAAAGIDIGATEIYVAVHPDHDPEPVRSFGTFTEELHRLADWLKTCGVDTVAMEATGVYWIPLFQILEARGFEVCGQCPVLPECSRPTDRCVGLSMATSPAFGRIAAAVLPACGSDLRTSVAGASSGQSHSDGVDSCTEDAEGAESDESANPPRY